MRTSKKILLFGWSIGIVFLLSCILSVGISVIFAVPFLPVVATTMAMIFIGHYLLLYYRDVKVIKTELTKLNAKPYKQYEIESACQSCGFKQPVAVDLDSLEYNCDKCKKANAIYVNFMTAAITEPSKATIV